MDIQAVNPRRPSEQQTSHLRPIFTEGRLVDAAACQIRGKDLAG
jgi:hypothetical protein